MTIRRLVIAIAFLAILFMAFRPMVDTDTWWHLRTGQWIVDHAALPEVDRFSFTRLGQQWYYPGWLAEILMVKVYSWGGLTALNFLFSGVFFLAFVLIFHTMDGDPFLRAAVLVLAAGVSEVYWSARPHAFTFLFAACFFLCLKKFLWEGKNTLWILPPIMALWVNVHAGFAVGFILLLAAVVGQGIRFLSHRNPRPPETGKQLGWLVGILVACLATSVINPYRWTILAYPFRTVSIEFLQKFIQEWQAPDFHYWEAQLFLILFLLAWTAIGFSPKPLDAADFVFLALFGYMGFLAWRNTNLLSVVAPAIIVRYAQPAIQAAFPTWDPGHAVSRRQSAIHTAIVSGLAVAVLLFGISSTAPAAMQEAVRRNIPVDAVAYLAEHPVQGRMFNSYNWGSYLLWNLPDQPVFVDGRTDLYDDEILSQYLVVAGAQDGWRDILDRWDIRMIFLEPTAPILELLTAEGWKVYYRDSQAIMLIRPGS